jgi:hypothetical protein
MFTIYVRRRSSPEMLDRVREPIEGFIPDAAGVSVDYRRQGAVTEQLFEAIARIVQVVPTRPMPRGYVVRKSTTSSPRMLRQQSSAVRLQ